MDERKRSTNRKNQGGGLGIGVFIAVYLLYTVMNGAFRGLGLKTIGRVLFLLLLVVLVGFAVGIVLKGKTAGKDTRSSASPFIARPVNREPVADLRKELHELFSRPERPDSSPLPASRPTAAPAREYSGDIQKETAARDRARRIKQLDDFYKNGIIDGAEYRILRNRYEKEDRG